MSCYANRYESLKSLGAGSAGTVLHVKDIQTGQEYALKTLSSCDISVTDLESFQSEFDVLRNLNHPNICQVYDAGQDKKKECYYLACELVKGKDLFKATENLPLDRIEELFVQALRAFNYLHQRSVFHLDVKPQNFLVEESDGKLNLKVIDFGFANFHKRHKNLNSPKGGVEGEAPSPQGGVEGATQAPIIGTAAYVAPEIIRGKPWDGRSDLYSLGISFYKALARRLPFESFHTQEAHRKHVEEKPPKPSEFNPNIPQYLDGILLKLLEKDPEKRYQKASDVIRDLKFYTNKNYEVETDKTRASYILEKGNLIARESEVKRFSTFYKDRLVDKTLKKSPYLIVNGERGSGKSRLLKEFENTAKKDLVTTLTWQEFKKTSLQELKMPCLVIGDDEEISEKNLQYVTLAFSKFPVLVVLSPRKDIFCHSDDKIELKRFSEKETREYLVKATNIPGIPDNIIRKIFDYTQGNPAYLTEYTKTLFQKGFFKDTQGTWSQEMLEDLGEKFKGIGTVDFIKQRLKNKLDELQLDKNQMDILTVLALTGKPTIIDLTELSHPNPVEKNLKFLVEKEILEIGTSNRYRFSNPLYK